MNRRYLHVAAALSAMALAAGIGAWVKSTRTGGTRLSWLNSSPLPVTPDDKAGGQGFARLSFGAAGGEAPLKQVEGPQGEQVRCQREDQPCSYLKLKALYKSGGEIPADLHITRKELGTLVSQLDALAADLSHYTSVDQICADGYRQTSPQTPNMGIHMLNRDYMLDGVFDPAKPEMLLLAKKGGESVPWAQIGDCVKGKWTGDPNLRVVGAAFVLPTEIVGDTHPEGFAGPLDNWHVHYNSCTGKNSIGTLTKEQCAARGGRFVEKAGWMLHAYAMPDFDSQAGVFAMWNPKIWPVVSVSELEASRGDEHSHMSMPDHASMPGHEGMAGMDHSSHAAAGPESLIFDFKFEDVTAKVGDTVTFRNIDGAFHTVTAGKPGAPTGTFDSGDLFADQTFSVKFDKPGEYTFFCKHHPNMIAKVVVK